MKTAADILREKGTPGMVSLPEDATIIDAVGKMAKEKIGAMLVQRGDKIVGIWTERDLIRNLLAPGFDPNSARIGEHMQTSLIAVQSDTPIVKLEEMFLGLFIRHILIKENEDYLGLLSIGDVLRSSLLEKDREIKELNRIASWEYYENWAWHHKYEPRAKGGKEES